MRGGRRDGDGRRSMGRGGAERGRRLIAGARVVHLLLHMHAEFATTAASAAAAAIFALHVDHLAFDVMTADRGASQIVSAGA